jgi:NTE family protein
MPDDHRTVNRELVTAPVVDLATDSGKPVEDNIAICLSGGGYRAMLFHAGVLWRLAEAGYLEPRPQLARFEDGTTRPIGTLKRISSVSGGSITSALLGLKWSQLAFGRNYFLASFVQHVIAPIRTLAGTTLAGQSLGGALKLIKDVVLPGSVNEHLAQAYEKHLYGSATVKSLPADPRFVINAANLQSGALWRFMSPYMRDWRVGENTHTDRVSLAHAVAASSAFPPFLAPAKFTFSDSDFTPRSGGDGGDNLQRPKFTTNVELADGGVYDNLGLETAYKRYRTLFVSDAGAAFKADDDVSDDWAGLSFRVLNVIDNQVRSLRKRLLINAFNQKERFGAYWGIGQDIGIYEARSALPCPYPATLALAAIETDLATKDARTQEQLINWGYALCDASVRTWLDRALPQPAGFPYPDSGV